MESRPLTPVLTRLSASSRFISRHPRDRVGNRGISAHRLSTVRGGRRNRGRGPARGATTRAGASRPGPACRPALAGSALPDQPPAVGDGPPAPLAPAWATAASLQSTVSARASWLTHRSNGAVIPTTSRLVPALSAKRSVGRGEQARGGEAGAGSTVHSRGNSV